MQKEIEDFLNEISGFQINVYLKSKADEFTLLDMIIDSFKELKKYNTHWNLNTLFGFVDYYNLPFNRAEILIRLLHRREIKNFNKLFGLPRRN